MPLGARMRGYFRNFATSDCTFSPSGLPCHDFIRCGAGRCHFERIFSSISYAKEYRKGSTGLADGIGTVSGDSMFKSSQKLASQPRELRLKRGRRRVLKAAGYKLDISED